MQTWRDKMFNRLCVWPIMRVNNFLLFLIAWDKKKTTKSKKKSWMLLKRFILNFRCKTTWSKVKDAFDIPDLRLLFVIRMFFTENLSEINHFSSIRFFSLRMFKRSCRGSPDYWQKIQRMKFQGNFLCWFQTSAGYNCQYN